MKATTPHKNERIKLLISEYDVILSSFARTISNERHDDFKPGDIRRCVIWNFNLDARERWLFCELTDIDMKILRWVGARRTGVQ